MLLSLGYFSFCYGFVVIFIIALLECFFFFLRVKGQHGQVFLKHAVVVSVVFLNLIRKKE